MTVIGDVTGLSSRTDVRTCGETSRTSTNAGHIAEGCRNSEEVLPVGVVGVDRRR